MRPSALPRFLKSSRNCVRCDWPVREHYSAIKHSAYVKRIFMEFKLVPRLSLLFLPCRPGSSRTGTLVTAGHVTTGDINFSFGVG